jgi:hypothetical protein
LGYFSLWIGKEKSRGPEPLAVPTLPVPSYLDWQRKK